MKMTKEKKRFSFGKLLCIPAFLGILIGVLAAFIQALIGSAGGPEAYGFCVVCHTRDMVNWAVNQLVENPNALGFFGSL